MPSVNKIDEYDSDDEAETTESAEQLLARLYDTATALQSLGIAEINAVEKENGVECIVIILDEVAYDSDNGFLQI